MAANNALDLVKVHALLAECGLEETAALLMAEAAQIGKKTPAVQAFVEATASTNSKSAPAASNKSDDSSMASSSSDSDSSSSSSSSSSSDSSSSSSSESSSESSSDSSDSSSSSDSESDSDSDMESSGEAPAKKRRLSLETPVKPKPNAIVAVPQTAPAKPASKGNHFVKRGEAASTPNTPFCRIRPEEVVYADDRLKNNTYMSKGGVENDFGYKAHKDLIVTRGKGFTKEKNKKKRGSYSGGKITMQSHSIKFD